MLPFSLRLILILVGSHVQWAREGKLAHRIGVPAVTVESLRVSLYKLTSGSVPNELIRPALIWGLDFEESQSAA